MLLFTCTVHEIKEKPATLAAARIENKQLIKGQPMLSLDGQRISWRGGYNWHACTQ
jgi:hypothetical protein